SGFRLSTTDGAPRSALTRSKHAVYVSCADLSVSLWPIEWLYNRYHQGDVHNVSMRL
ncbi:hypothetical protein LCGC14_2834790, partial [marine sediment metagenome]